MEENLQEKVALCYWCTGTGHAARMIPVAKEFESRGLDVSVAGGGNGRKFVEMNGFEHPGLTEVPDPAEFSVLEFLPRVFDSLIPSALRRTYEIHGWLKEEQPEKLVTDDVFAMISASLQGIEFYRIDHLTPEILQSRWSIIQRFYNSLSMIFGEEIIVTSLWKEEKGGKNITRVDPLAQEGEDEVKSYDVLLSPGQWGGQEFKEIDTRLAEKGYEVRTVGDDSWETKPSMTPYTEAAEVVLCTGFSSIADTVVAGTPCIVYPFLPFQKAIAKGIEDRNLKGIETADSVEGAVKAVERCLEGSCENPEYENGAPELVDTVL